MRERLAELKRAVRELAKLDEERTEKLAEASAHADREVAQVKKAAADLARICADPEEAERYFVVAERRELKENEFNLHVPRYVDTFAPEEKIDLRVARDDFAVARSAASKASDYLLNSLNGLAATKE